jgi:hypothetical protein
MFHVKPSAALANWQSFTTGSHFRSRTGGQTPPLQLTIEDCASPLRNERGHDRRCYVSRETSRHESGLALPLPAGLPVPYNQLPPTADNYGKDSAPAVYH